MAQDVAPGGLEPVRVFLNTWRVPTDTRVPRDLLDEWVADPQEWTRELADLPRPQQADLPALRDLRADLRAALGVRHPVGLAGVLESHPLRVELCPEGADRPVEWVPLGDTTADHLVARVVTAVAEGRWHRLKACPDCVHVFYDVSRNASRTWCAMTPTTPNTRACGAAAKTRAHRERVRRTRAADTAR